MRFLLIKSQKAEKRTKKNLLKIFSGDFGTKEVSTTQDVPMKPS